MNFVPFNTSPKWLRSHIGKYSMRSLTFFCLLWLSPAIASGQAPAKIDLVIYDRPNWNSFTYNYPILGGVQVRENDEIVIRFDTANANKINDDFYIEEYQQVVLSSKDKGKTWNRIAPSWPHNMPLKLSNGVLVDMVVPMRLKTPQQRKLRLVKLGIGDIWNNQCRMFWDFWPQSMAAKLKEQGFHVWDLKVGATPDDTYLPDGTVATHAPTSFVGRISKDAGKSWRDTTAFDGRRYGHLGCMFAGSAVLPDDTIMIPAYGILKSAKEKKTQVFVLRSTDGGQSFSQHSIPGKSYNESTIVSHPSGVTLAVMRSVAGPIFVSRSTDRGATWSEPKNAGFEGSPLHAICLRSGTIVCTYADRWKSGSFRATVSTDAGKTWHVERTKVLHGSLPKPRTKLSGPGQWLGGTGTAQLSDGRVFVFYSVPDARKLKELGAGQIVKAHSYVAGNIVTEAFLLDN